MTKEPQDDAGSQPGEVRSSDQLGLVNREEDMGTPKTDPDYEHSEAALREADAFDAWMRSVNPRHQQTDDGMDTRVLRKCWDAAKEAGRLQVASMCVERAALAWAAADETPFDKDRMRLEAEASVLDSLATELRA